MWTSFVTPPLAMAATVANPTRARARTRGWRSVPGTVLLLSWVDLATPARAQITVSPSAGISGEGQPAAGAAIGMSLGAVRPEVELGWARRGIDRRAATPSEPQGEFARAGGPVYLRR